MLFLVSLLTSTEKNKIMEKGETTTEIYDKPRLT